MATTVQKRMPAKGIDCVLLATKSSWSAVSPVSDCITDLFLWSTLHHLRRHDEAVEVIRDDEDAAKNAGIVRWSWLAVNDRLPTLCQRQQKQGPSLRANLDEETVKIHD